MATLAASPHAPWAWHSKTYWVLIGDLRGEATASEHGSGVPRDIEGATR